MAIVLGTNSWLTEAAADTYFGDRLGASDFWISGADKDAALITAFKQLNSAGYSFPAVATQNMKDGQCEQALFLLMDTAIDKRLSLQTQKVKSAGIVKEVYDLPPAMPPISAMAQALLADYIDENANLRGHFLTEIQRDEDEAMTFTYDTD